MTKAAVSSILKSIKMNPSGDEGRSRYSSMYGGLNSRYYNDSDRYVRSRTVDAPGYFDRYNSDRYGRRQSRDVSREMRFRSSGSLDRGFPSRLVLDDPIPGRAYVDDRYVMDEAHADRYLSPREMVPRDVSMARREDGRFDRYVYDRQAFDHDRYGYVPEPYYPARPAYERSRYAYDYGPVDRDYRRPVADRYGYESRYALDRTHFEDRYSQERANQPGRVRFDSEQQPRNERRRSSAAAGRDESGSKETVRSEEGRSKSPASGRDAESDKQAEDVPRKEEKIPSRRSSERMQERQSSRHTSIHMAEKSTQFEGSRKSSAVSRRESEKQVSSRPSEVEDYRQSPVKEFEKEQDSLSLSRRESERRVSPQPSLRDEHERRDSPRRLSRRESEREQIQEAQSRAQSDIHMSPLPISRRDSEREFAEEQVSTSRRPSEKERQLSTSRRESEYDPRLQPPSRRDSERRLSPQPMSRRESERQPSPQTMARRDSEREYQELRQRSPVPLSRRESEREVVQDILRRESEREASQISRSRRDSERDYTQEPQRSRRESERILNQEPLIADDQDMRVRRESEHTSRSRRDSERDMDQDQGSRAHSLTRKSDGSLPGSRRGSESAMEIKPAMSIDGRRESLQSRESEARITSRRTSERDIQPTSDKDSERGASSPSRRVSEREVSATSRRESERELRPRSRQESERVVFSPSRRESERVVLSPSRKGSEYEARSPARRDSERDNSRSRRQSERQEDNASRRGSSKPDDKQDSRRSSLQKDAGSRSGSRSRKSSEREQQINVTIDNLDAGSPERQVETQAEDRKSNVRGRGYFGSQFSGDRMPPPIPPYAEPHSNYPVSKEYTAREDEQNLMRRHELAMRVAYNMMRKRYYERSNDPTQNPVLLQHGDNTESFYSVAPPAEDVLRVDTVDFLCSENAKNHKTFDYEMVKDIQQPNPVYRRGQSFFLDINFHEREFDPTYDLAYLNFYSGASPSVPKGTQAVLPILFDTEFHRAPYQWDVRFIKKEANIMSLEVFVPVVSPVGIWRCVVETSTKEYPGSKLQHRCAEDIYVIFNPFDEDDGAYVQDDDQRYEYVFKDTGKIYTGGYRNVRGRPWIFGQFDDCVLPAACVLLEMSGLSHAERGNPVKVTRALTSMIKASRSDKESFSQNFTNGLIVPKFEDNYNGGNSPHLWTGSVQIFEEFLRRGIAPVKYGQCWVMAGLLTSVCRAFGLAARPVTAFANAFDSQDTFTVDKYIDRFGDTQENGPNKSKQDLVWSFHSWCEVHMNRTDQANEYSGWQATDPCSTFREDSETGSCGPCPVEALRKGDVGQDDVASFYSSLNAYVRFFYEDDESGWGHSPFRQFRYPMSRYILTKSPGDLDHEGDEDCLDITSNYCDDQATDAEKFANFNAYRGVAKTVPPFEYQAASSSLLEYDPKGTDQKNFDVKFELETPERAMIGQSLVIPVVITNMSSETRTIQSTICTRSSFYTGTLGPCLKRTSTQLTLEPDQRETVSMTLDSWNYEHKVIGMSFVKITTTGFVQETGQSFVDEFDFRFSKPELNIEVQNGHVGVNNEATFSFKNPLDVPLTECYITMEVSGSVRPRTIRLNREVRPREIFTYTHSFVARLAGDRRVVACFTSRQLADVVGHKPLTVHE